ncbi:class I SAM-dependent methyltransferase [Agromyces sp. SYSU T00194]|uniref:class I SAM-dependent methyltransferase n=1 Tax=Agromyces chitinivorans TaxID=3158560 RepID=UPI0033936EDA
MSTGEAPGPKAPQGGADAFAERVFGSVLGAFETLSIHVGDRLGWYRALRFGPMNAEELAATTGTDRRYAREWLEQQAAYGVLEASAETGPGASERRRFTLPPAHAEVLTDVHSLAYAAPLARMFAAAARAIDPLLDAYRGGGGVSWAELGEDARDAQGDVNRPWFEQRLGPALAGVPWLHELLSRPGVRIADVGCGHGWSSIALAQAYPAARVDGHDIDVPSLEAAEVHAREAGVDDRVAFFRAGGEELAGAGTYDAAFIFEALHDMPFPVDVLRATRDALTPGGVVVVMDEAVGEEFTAPADEIDRIMYGYSLFVCLPDGLSTPGSAGTGTVMRPSTLEAYAREAGFGEVEVLPIEGFAAFRFTALRR